MHILSLNVGSSSIKYAAYQTVFAKERLLFDGAMNKDGLAPLLEHLKGKKFVPEVVGHRLVFGGARFYEPIRVNTRVLKELKAMVPFAPLHLPPAINAIEHVQKQFSKALHVACFDTAFHHSLPSLTQTLPLPLSLRESGIRRFGFHGLSYEYILSQLKKKESRRLIVAHLGNGASLAAIRNGKCIDTTMGFTPSSGIIMSTRTGDIDPGVLLYLMRERNYNLHKLTQLVNHESGLIGISNESSDVKTLLKSKSKNAKLAIDMFCYRISQAIASFAASLGGVETLVFTGGIGENSHAIRLKVCNSLEFLGMRLDRKKNEAHEVIVSSKKSDVVVKVVPTNEELMLAKHARIFLRS